MEKATDRTPLMQLLRANDHLEPAAMNARLKELFSDWKEEELIPYLEPCLPQLEEWLAKHPDRQPVAQYLTGVWTQSRGTLVLLEKADLTTAEQLFVVARNAYESLSMTEETLLVNYLIGIVEFRKSINEGNMVAAEEQLHGLKTSYAATQAQFPQFRALTDVLEPDMYLFQGMRQYGTGDTAKGHYYLSKATQACRKNAKEHFADDDHMSHYMLGLGHFLDCVRISMEETAQLQRYNLLYFEQPAESSLEAAVKAIEEFSECNLQVKLAEQLLFQSKYQSVVLEVRQFIIKSLLELIYGNGETVISIGEFSQKLKEAEKYSLRAAENGELFIDTLEMCRVQLDSLEKMVARKAGMQIDYSTQSNETRPARKEALLDLIGENKLNRVMKELMVIAREPEQFARVILLQNQKNKLKAAVNLGTLSPDVAEAKHNQFVHALITFVTDL